MSSHPRSSELALIPLEQRPFNAETPLAALAEPITPTPLFYVRNHFDVPRLDPDSWQLRVGGLVEQPLGLSLPELRRFPECTLAVTLECAGNGRARMTPVPPGTPWGYGAAATASFTGTPLTTVVERAGLRPDTVEILFVGADAGDVAPGRPTEFGRSLPVTDALHPDVLLAWEMNGEPLSAAHGSPLRLVVPGWYGVASVKWLVSIEALAAPYGGYFQREKYVYVGERGMSDGMPVRRMRVRAVIARPADGEVVEQGPIEIAGSAWSGAAPVVRVEVSGDGGRSWSEAELGRPPSSYAASPWRLEWAPPSPGTHTLAARATDDSGNTQPLEPVWNAQGYGNNAVQRVIVQVRTPQPLSGSPLAEPTRETFPP